MEAVTAHTSGIATNCKYQGCHQPRSGGKELCFWHDPSADKRGDDIAARLQALANEGESLQGFQLQGAKLRGLRLIHPNDEKRIDLSFANLHRADLRGAHLYRVDLHRANLLKANFTEANLNFADLSGTNLLGVRLERCRMEHVNWGRTLYQEVLLEQKHINKHPLKRKTLIGEAEEVCRSVRQSCESHGLFDEAGHFFHKEMTLRRKQFPMGSWQRWTSKLVDLFCGYGERPLRVVSFSMVLIVLCALFYFIAGLEANGEALRLEFHVPFSQNVESFFNALYFSVVTFTTLGYGDLIPIGPSRALAAMEAFFGNFTLALFVVVFVKKMTR